MNRIRYLEIRMVPVGLGSEGQSLHELETEQMLGREENNGVCAGLKGSLPKHPGNYNCDLVWKKVFIEAIKLRVLR